jgi:hypothetical protein
MYYALCDHLVNCVVGSIAALFVSVLSGKVTFNLTVCVRMYVCVYFVTCALRLCPPTKIQQ